MSNAGIWEAHVEEGGEDEGEQGDGGSPNQVQNWPKAWHRLGNEQQAEDWERSEGAALPVEIWRNQYVLPKGGQIISYLLEH